MPESLTKPITRLIAVLTAVAALYGCNIAVSTYVLYDANKGERARLQAQLQSTVAQANQAIAQLQSKIPQKAP